MISNREKCFSEANPHKIGTLFSPRYFRFRGWQVRCLTLVEFWQMIHSSCIEGGGKKKHNCGASDLRAAEDRMGGPRGLGLCVCENKEVQCGVSEETQKIRKSWYKSHLSETLTIHGPLTDAGQFILLDL